MKFAKLLPFLFLLVPLAGRAQNPQTQINPNFAVNAGWANGVAPGYAPTAGSGLTLNVGAGTASCGTAITYAGGTLSLTNNTTNYVYLSAETSCLPAFKTTAFTVNDVQIATVVTLSGAITSISDMRTPFVNTEGGPAPRVVTIATDTIACGDRRMIIIYNRATAIAVTLPGQASAACFGQNFSFSLISRGVGTVTLTTTDTFVNPDGTTSMTLVVNQTAGCTITSDGTNLYYPHCGANTTGVGPIGAAGGDLSGTYPNPTVAKVAGTIAATVKMRSIGTSFGDIGGSALTAGSIVYMTVPYACTISGWNITADAGTVTFDIWKIATGTAIPTVSNTITASALPALASGTAIHSTTLTAWTTSVAADDIFGFQLKTVATAKYVEIDLECAQ